MAIATMNSPFLFRSVLNTLHQHIALVDEHGAIQWVNQGWEKFHVANAAAADLDWIGVNYLTACYDAAATGDHDAEVAAAGIRTVFGGKSDDFYFEYPCHSPSEERWFLMHFQKLDWDGPSYFVAAHLDITERKSAENRIEQMSQRDGLTGIANRRRFDAFLEEQWNRSRRYRQPVSLLFIDVDLFKDYNDHYGHVAGDECLRRIGKCLTDLCRRPDDLAARYGGEEFCIILGNTGSGPAGQLGEAARAAIENLSIPNKYGVHPTSLTVSVGVATHYPSDTGNDRPEQLVEAADRATYKAKKTGRNRVCVAV